LLFHLHPLVLTVKVVDTPTGFDSKSCGYFIWRYTVPSQAPTLHRVKRRSRSPDPLRTDESRQAGGKPSYKPSTSEPRRRDTIAREMTPWSPFPGTSSTRSSPASTSATPPAPLCFPAPGAAAGSRSPLLLRPRQVLQITGLLGFQMK
jgi:hypothetical protein